MIELRAIQSLTPIFGHVSLGDLDGDGGSEIVAEQGGRVFVIGRIRQ